MNYLVDTSALVRIWRKQVDPVWRDIVGRGQVAVCEPVLAETLMISDAIRVLHEDADFETVARFVPLLQEKRISTAP